MNEEEKKKRKKKKYYTQEGPLFHISCCLMQILFPGVVDVFFLIHGKFEFVCVHLSTNCATQLCVQVRERKKLCIHMSSFPYKQLCTTPDICRSFYVK